MVTDQSLLETQSKTRWRTKNDKSDAIYETTPHTKLSFIFTEHENNTLERRLQHFFLGGGGGGGGGGGEGGGGAGRFKG